MSERETALSRSQIATLRELADDLSQIVVAVSSRDGDATARQHQRAEAVRAVVEWLAGADPVPVCQWREIATAPKDGTRILLTPAVWTAKKVVSAYYRLGLWWVESADVRGSMRAFTDPDDDASHWPFTHWMPLPAPPVALVPAEQTNKE